MSATVGGDALVEVNLRGGHGSVLTIAAFWKWHAALQETRVSAATKGSVVCVCQADTSH
jgi:hypothetical protein